VKSSTTVVIPQLVNYKSGTDCRIAPPCRAVKNVGVSSAKKYNFFSFFLSDQINCFGQDGIRERTKITEWPDWEHFRPMGEGNFGQFFEHCKSSPKFVAMYCFSPRYSVCKKFIFLKSSAPFWAIFYQPIRSSRPQKYSTKKESPGLKAKFCWFPKTKTWLTSFLESFYIDWIGYSFKITHLPTNIKSIFKLHVCTFYTDEILMFVKLSLFRKLASVNY
jgi:hypothetical protein